jgi:hypothetical protein
MLNDLLKDSAPRASMISDNDAGLVVLSSADISTIQTHTNVPFDQECPSAFLDKSPAQVHAIYSDCVRPEDGRPSYMSRCTFLILDERTLKDRSVMLCTDQTNTLETVRSDFATSLRNVIPLELMTLSMAETTSSLAEGEMLTLQIAEEDDKKERRYLEAHRREREREEHTPKTPLDIDRAEGTAEVPSVKK